jgi:transposase
MVPSIYICGAAKFGFWTEDEGVVLERRIDTTREAVTQLFGARGRMRILLESSTESEWVAQHLETLGHEVVVADPNYAPMYGGRSRKIKNGQTRCGRRWRFACRRGIYRAAHRASRPARTLRQQLRVRRHLVQVRTGLISPAAVHAAAGRPAIALRVGGTRGGPARSAGGPGDGSRRWVAPRRTALADLTATLATIDTAVEAHATGDAAAQRLMTGARCRADSVPDVHRGS